MSYVFRTPGPWGPASQNFDLSAAQIDGNFWQAILDIQAKAVQGVGIANFNVVGDQMTVVLTDHTLLGPYTLPTVTLEFRGEWQPNTTYHVNDIFTHGGSTYIVVTNHTSAATFDPGATDGVGHSLYGLLLTNPAGALPAGGALGAFLRKASGADYDDYWGTASLHDLSDVTGVSSPGPINGDVLTYSAGFFRPLPIPAPALESLSDVSIPESPRPAIKDRVAWSGTQWTAQAPSIIQSITPNQPVAGPNVGQPAVWNGTEFTNSSTIDIPIATLNPQSVSGGVTIDRKNGEIQTFFVSGNVSSVTIINWGPYGNCSRLFLEIINGGAYTWDWSGTTGLIWAGAVVPLLSNAGMDLYMLVSFTAGGRIYGNVIGQAYG